MQQTSDPEQQRQQTAEFVNVTNYNPAEQQLERSQHTAIEIADGFNEKDNIPLQETVMSSNNQQHNPPLTLRQIHPSLPLSGNSPPPPTQRTVIVNNVEMQERRCYSCNIWRPARGMIHASLFFI